MCFIHCVKFWAFSCCFPWLCVALITTRHSVIWNAQAIVDLLFGIDIVLNFRTGIVESDGVVDLQPKSARMKYLKSWFLVDFLSVLPVSYLALAVTGECGTAGGNIKAFKVIRLVRLLKMLKLAQLRSAWAMYEREYEGMEAAGKFIKVIAAAIMILYMCHLVACMWFYSGTVGADAGSAVKDGWIARAGIVTVSHDAPAACADLVATVAAAEEAGICDADVRCTFNPATDVCEAAAVTPLVEQYVESFYWSITVLSTVGFGDITPATKVEKTFSILAELIGCVTFAMLMGSLGESKRSF